MRIAPFSAAAFHGAGLARRRSARDDRVRDYGGAADVAGPAIGLSSERAIQQTARLMPPKIRELIAELERAGFVNRGVTAATVTSYTRTSPALSLWPVRAATTPSTTR